MVGCCQVRQLYLTTITPYYFENYIPFINLLVFPQKVGEGGYPPAPPPSQSLSDRCDINSTVQVLKEKLSLTASASIVIYFNLCLTCDEFITTENKTMCTCNIM